MDFNGYKRTKKFDIKRWFKGTNSIVYLVILVVMVLGLVFVLKTVIGMHNNNKKVDDSSVEETISDNSSENNTQTQTVAKNQSYYMRISIAKHTLVVYQLDDNNEFTIPVKAFKVALGPKVAPAKTAISEKSLWRKITDIYYVRYSSRLDNAEYLSTATYYSQSDNNLNPKSYNAIGQNVSDGSILMTCANAKWIYENCGAKTTVEIVEDFDISSAINVEDINRIADNAYRDPTDDLKDSSPIQQSISETTKPTETQAETVSRHEETQRVTETVTQSATQQSSMQQTTTQSEAHSAASQSTTQ
mgnify:CR=1 FL=1|jgi:lipoprotein-anchoring transpeptidase ErfK/SrfK